jgi:hypothetical protein
LVSPEEQIPRGPEPARDDNNIEGVSARLKRLLKKSVIGALRGLKSAKEIRNKRLRRWPEGQHYPKSFFSAACKAEVIQSVNMHR